MASLVRSQPCSRTTENTTVLAEQRPVPRFGAGGNSLHVHPELSVRNEVSTDEFDSEAENGVLVKLSPYCAKRSSLDKRASSNQKSSDNAPSHTVVLRKLRLAANARERC